MFQTHCDSEALVAVFSHRKDRRIPRVVQRPSSSRARRAILDTPAITIDASVTQARAALRAFRQAIKDGVVKKADPSQPYCCCVQLPLPHPGEENTIQLLQDRKFPGGVIQKFRKLRPPVDDLLFGYDTTFVGMVPDPADGVGLWRCTTDLGMTVVANVSTLTLETLVDLCEGKFGPGPTRPDHCVVAVNCMWSTGEDVGQFWQRQLKQRAKVVIEDTMWHDVYQLAPLKTMTGATGWLYHAWGRSWKVYSCLDDEAKQKGELLKEFSDEADSLRRPERTAVAQLLGEAADQRDPRRKLRLPQLW